jgi:hypothetical protein
MQCTDCIDARWACNGTEAVFCFVPGSCQP